MSTKREIIDSLRNKLRERNADSKYTNQFLYQTLLEQAKWLILRESSAGRIWRSNFLFQSFTVKLTEVSVIPSCLPIKAGCKIYRSVDRLPEMWQDGSGIILKSVSSVDGNTDFFYTTSGIIKHKQNDPYRRKLNQKYCYFEDGYLWIPEVNPHYVTILSYFMDDINLSSQNPDCDTEDCIRFLDTIFTAPQWVEAELLSKAVELLAGISKRIPEDEEINKNTTNKS